MAYQAVIFDLDGTLIDSALGLTDSLNVLLTGLGRRTVTVSQVHQMIGEGAAMLVQRALQATGPVLDVPQHTQRFLEIYDSLATTHTRAFDGVASLLEELSSRAVHCALCTNKPAKPTAQILAHLGWSSWFSVVVAGDSLPVRKPDPAMVVHCLDAMKCSPDAAVLIGDSPADAAAAKAAGVDFVAVSWGYSRVDVQSLPSKKVVHHMDELRALLRAQTI